MSLGGYVTQVFSPALKVDRDVNNCTQYTDIILWYHN